MTDFFLQIGLSNACFSLVLAVAAMLVGAKARRPHLAHMLWLLVFIKLVTPPIVGIPIVSIPGQGETAVAVSDHLQPGSAPADNLRFTVDEEADGSMSARIWAMVLDFTRGWFAPIWLLGSAVVFVWSMVRVCRFRRLLATESEVAPQELQTAAVEIAGRLGLKRIPAIYMTSTRLSPLVWWVGGKVRIVIPTTLLETMDAQQSQWVLAHELAHVRRRDHLVRWLEWAACVCFWWNPVVWWAQRNLRAMEEICCDDLVISCLNPKPKFYANSLLSAVEFLARPVIRPPAMASEINSGGFLERRFKMIVSDNSKRSNSRWLQICVLLCAMVVLPLRIASAADYEAVGRRLRAAVAAGELTGEEARIMIGALRRSAQQGDWQGSDRDDEPSRYEGFARRIRAAVAEGKMTPEEGREQLAGFRRRMAMAERGERERGKRSITVEEYRRAEAKMRKMVEDGKAKPEDVERRLIEMRKMMAEQGDPGEKRTWREDGGKRDVDWEGIKKRIEGAVKSGKITRKEADAQYEAIKKRMAGRTDGDRGRRRTRGRDPEAVYKAAEKEIKAEIAAGKITKEQGRERLAEMRKIIGEKGEASARKRGRDGEAKRDVDWEGIKKRIEGAVKSGDMTREEADAKYKAMKERMAGGGKR